MSSPTTDQFIQIPKDAFSDGQVRSKIWLSKHLDLWSKKYLNEKQSYCLNWYGSWVGLGPFMVLSTTSILFHKLNLIELDQSALVSSRKILDHWHCHSYEINYLQQDMNQFNPSREPNQIFINTACEHVIDTEWLKQIPQGSFILLQSTDMPHIEHINISNNLNEFELKMIDQFKILEKSELNFIYPSRTFSRFMLFGQK